MIIAAVAYNLKKLLKWARPKAENSDNETRKAEKKSLHLPFDVMAAREGR